MQIERARKLRLAWLAHNGADECVHGAWEKEYIFGYDTGDKICARCGAERTIEGTVTETRVLVEALYK